MVVYRTSTTHTLTSISCAAVRDLGHNVVTNTVLHNVMALGGNLRLLS